MNISSAATPKNTITQRWVVNAPERAACSPKVVKHLSTNETIKFSIRNRISHRMRTSCTIWAQLSARTRKKYTHEYIIPSVSEFIGVGLLRISVRAGTPMLLIRWFMNQLARTVTKKLYITHHSGDNSNGNLRKIGCTYRDARAWNQNLRCVYTLERRYKVVELTITYRCRGKIPVLRELMYWKLDLDTETSWTPRIDT